MTASTRGEPGDDRPAVPRGPVLPRRAAHRAGPRHLRGPADPHRGTARPRHHPVRHPDRVRGTPLVPAPARPGAALPARPLPRPAPRTRRRRGRAPAAAGQRHLRLPRRHRPARRPHRTHRAGPGGRRGRARDRPPGTARRTGRRHLRHRRLLPRQPGRVRARRRRPRGRLHLRRRTPARARAHPGTAGRRGGARCGGTLAGRTPGRGRAERPGAAAAPAVDRRRLGPAAPAARRARRAGRPRRPHRSGPAHRLRAGHRGAAHRPRPAARLPVPPARRPPGRRLPARLRRLRGRAGAHRRPCGGCPRGGAGARPVRKDPLLQRRPRSARAARGGRPAVPPGARPGARHLGHGGRGRSTTPGGWPA